MLNNTFDIKKNIQFFLQNYKIRQSSLNGNEGFTLLELIVAASITLAVLTIAGIGIVALLKQNKTAISESDRRANLNRALDFISNEVRMAKSINTTNNSAVDTTNGLAAGDNITLPSGFNIAASTYGLTLTFPDNTKSVYFVAPSDKQSTCNKTSSLWQCPFALFRANGSYSSGSTIPTDDPKMVVDGLKAPSTLPSCSNSNRSVGTTGFYGCITKNSQVILSSYGKLTETDSTTLAVSSTAVTRAK
ncbi:MAG: hypothetical protein WCO29_04740 [Nostocales cyanobacterium ELA583]|jgi:Tfp pilus assembly protein PilW